MNVYNYHAGCCTALVKLGLDADTFAQLVQEDDTDLLQDQHTDAKDMDASINKTPAWSGPNSMEAGDAGTRNYQLGLPRAGAV